MDSFEIFFFFSFSLDENDPSTSSPIPMEEDIPIIPKPFGAPGIDLFDFQDGVKFYYYLFKKYFSIIIKLN